MCVDDDLGAKLHEDDVPGAKLEMRRLTLETRQGDSVRAKARGEKARQSENVIMCVDDPGAKLREDDKGAYYFIRFSTMLDPPPCVIKIIIDFDHPSPLN